MPIVIRELNIKLDVDTSKDDTNKEKQQIKIPNELIDAIVERCKRQILREIERSTGR